MSWQGKLPGSCETVNPLHLDKMMMVAALLNIQSPSEASQCSWGLAMWVLVRIRCEKPQQRWFVVAMETKKWSRQKPSSPHGSWGQGSCNHCGGKMRVILAPEPYEIWKSQRKQEKGWTFYQYWQQEAKRQIWFGLNKYVNMHYLYPKHCAVTNSIIFIRLGKKSFNAKTNKLEEQHRWTSPLPLTTLLLTYFKEGFHWKNPWSLGVSHLGATHTQLCSSPTAWPTMHVPGLYSEAGRKILRNVKIIKQHPQGYWIPFPKDSRVPVSWRIPFLLPFASFPLSFPSMLQSFQNDENTLDHSWKIQQTLDFYPLIISTPGKNSHESAMSSGWNRGCVRIKIGK